MGTYGLPDICDYDVDFGWVRRLFASDHGNVEAIGLGRPREGMLADLKGERVRIFPNEMLRAATASQFQPAIWWPPE